MTTTAELPVLATGSSAGQPVACVDARSLPHDATTISAVRDALSGTLEQIGRDFFVRQHGDPTAIVAVLTRPAGDTGDGLLFVAADGPLGGCGEATMFAGAIRTADTGSAVTFETTSGPIVATSNGADAVTLRMPPVAATSVKVEGRHLSFRTVTVAGNTFAVVPAADAGLGSATSAGLASLGDTFLQLLGPAVVEQTGGPAPTMLLLTEPVVDGSTRSAVVWGNAILNRGPCGTGTCARLVVALEDGELAPTDVLRHHSPFGHAFEARLDSPATDALSILLTGRVDLGT